MLSIMTTDHILKLSQIDILKKKQKVYIPQLAKSPDLELQVRARGSDIYVIVTWSTQ